MQQKNSEAITASTASENRKNDRMMFLTIIVLAANLRACFTGVGTLVPLIRESLEINNTVAGMITTLPLLIFVFVSPQTASIGRRFGIGKTLMVAYSLLLVGVVFRAFFGLPGLFIGTAIMAFGIGVGNILTLSLIKLRFPNRIGVVTGAYSVAMGAASALTIGISVPVATGTPFGWQGALSMWGILALVSIILWIGRTKTEPLLQKVEQVETDTKKYDRIVYKIPLAWCYAMYFGMQTLVYYGITAWLPSMMQSRGYTLDQAAMIAVYFQVISLPATLGVPILCARMRDQRKLFIVFAIMLITGFSVLSFAENIVTIIISLALAAWGIGSALGFSFTFASLRVENAQQSAALSGMGQTMGFVVAAFAPTIMGFMYDISNSWTMPFILLISCSVMWLILGIPLAKEGNIFKKYQ